MRGNRKKIYIIIVLIVLAIFGYKKLIRYQAVHRDDCGFYSRALNLCKDTYYKQIKSEDFLASIDLNKKILEIGPYCNPKMIGKNVKYFDLLDKESLQQQITSRDPNAQDYNKCEENVPNIDYADPQGDLSIVKEKFDIVFSSHNIEHQVDLIKHLNQVADLLEKDGKFYLIVPDKRYCFDHYISESTLADIISTHYSNGKNHSLDAVLTYKCESAHNDTKQHWNGKHGSLKGENGKCYVDALNEFKAKGDEYINIHRWRFTPQHFEFIINELYKLGLISLKVEKVYPTENKTNNFFAVLQLNKNYKK